jgi:hypothetical protein
MSARSRQDPATCRASCGTAGTPLREQSMLLPITHPNEFSLAANDMQDGQFVPVETPGAEGAWARMAARAHSWPGPGSDHVRVARFSEQDHVQRIANSLAPATLHLIVMARCRADVLPSLTRRRSRWSTRPVQGKLPRRLPRLPRCVAALPRHYPRPMATARRQAARERDHSPAAQG